MDVPHEFARAARLVSELMLLQLLICFAFSLARADPFVVASIVGLYAVREMDRRALELYLLLVGVGAALDVLFLLIHEPSPLVLLGTLVGLVLKLAVISPCYQLWESMPPTRLASLTPDAVTAHIKTSVASVLTRHAQARSMARVESGGASEGAFSAVSPPRHGVPARPAPVRLPTPTLQSSAGAASPAASGSQRSAGGEIATGTNRGVSGSWEAV